MHRNLGALFFAIIAAVFFLPFLGGVHLFDWDEINFAEIAREMLVLDNYLEPHINYAIFTEKPPLFFWLQSISMWLFGVNEYAARLPNAIMGIIVLPAVYQIGKMIYNNRFGYFWALAYFGSILPHLYFKSGIIDPVFNFFIFYGIYFLIKYHWSKNDFRGLRFVPNRSRLLFWAGLFTGLAVLTKGPVALLITGLVVFIYWIRNRFKFFIPIPKLFTYLLIVLGVTGIWFGVNIVSNGTQFIEEFTIRQWELFSTPDAGHGGFLGYHFVVLLFGCFPASVFMIQGMFRSSMKSEIQKDFNIWMTILFWTVLILFTIVKSKIVHYSSLAYYPLTYLAAVSLYHISEGKWKFSGAMRAALTLIGIIAALLTAIIPFAGRNIERIKSLFKKDPFALANLDANVNWTGWEATAGIFMFLIVAIAIFGYKERNKTRSINVLFFGTAIWVMLTLVLYIGKIESYSQRAAISFWEAQQGKDVYVATYDYKSYADLFYSKIQPQTHLDYIDNKWLFHGEIDKPVYISCKITAKDKLESELRDVIFLYQSNGFYFYKRNP